MFYGYLRIVFGDAKSASPPLSAIFYTLALSGGTVTFCPVDESMLHFIMLFHLFNLLILESFHLLCKLGMVHQLQIMDLFIQPSLL